MACDLFARCACLGLAGLGDVSCGLRVQGLGASGLRGLQFHHLRGWVSRAVGLPKPAHLQGP